MKNVLVALGMFAFLIVPGAHASFGDGPKADALSYGQNAHGCYYFSAEKKIVYAKDFSFIVDDSSMCLAKYDHLINDKSVYAEWRATYREALKALAK